MLPHLSGVPHFHVNRPSIFPKRSWGKLWDSNKIYCFLRDQSLSDSLYGWKFIKPRCNSGRLSTFAGNSALLPSDIIDFAMLPAQIFWCQTVSLLDVMWPRSNQWERALREKNSSYITIHVITSNGLNTMRVMRDNSIHFHFFFFRYFGRLGHPDIFCWSCRRYKTPVRSFDPRSDLDPKQGQHTAQALWRSHTDRIRL